MVEKSLPKGLPDRRRLITVRRHPPAGDRMTPPPANIEAIAQDFELLDDWEDKIQHTIELGRALPPLFG